MPEQQWSPLESYLYEELTFDRIKILAEKLGNTGNYEDKREYVEGIVRTLDVADKKATAYARLLDIVLMHYWEHHDTTKGCSQKFLDLVAYVRENFSFDTIDLERIALKEQLANLYCLPLFQQQEVTDVFAFLWKDEEGTKLILKPKVSHAPNLFTRLNSKTSDEDPKYIEANDDIQKNIQGIINTNGVLPKIHIVTYWDFVIQYEIEKMKFDMHTAHPPFSPLLRNFSVVFYCSWNFFCFANTKPGQVITCIPIDDEKFEKSNPEEFYLVTKYFSEKYSKDKWEEFVDRHPFFGWYSDRESETISPLEIENLLPINGGDSDLWVSRLMHYCHNLQDVERLILAFQEEKNYNYILSMVKAQSQRKESLIPVVTS